MVVFVDTLFVAVLENILAYLDLKDWIALEQVSDEWESALRRYFDLQITLDIDKLYSICETTALPYMLENHMRTKFRIVYFGILDADIDRFPLKTVDLSRITVLYIPGWKLAGCDMQKITHCRHLLHLCVRVANTVRCKPFKKIFLRNLCLLSLNVQGHECDRLCTKAIPESLSNLYLRRNFLVNFVLPPSWDQLHILSINDCYEIPPNFILVAITHLRQLIHFSFNLFNHPSDSIIVPEVNEPLLIHRHITKLNFINNKTCDEDMIITIAKVCRHLRNISVGTLPFTEHHTPMKHTLELTVFSMHALVHLRELRRICLYDVNEFHSCSFSVLQYCRELQIIEIINSKFMLVNFVSWVTWKCVYLRHLTILGMEFSLEALQVARQSVILQRNFSIRFGSTKEDRTLKLTIDEGSFDAKTVRRNSDRWLKVIFSTVSAHCDLVWKDICGI